jgi:hypothetical protein
MISFGTKPLIVRNTSDSSRTWQLARCEHQCARIGDPSPAEINNPDGVDTTLNCAT